MYKIFLRIIVSDSPWKAEWKLHKTYTHEKHAKEAFETLSKSKEFEYKLEVI